METKNREKLLMIWTGVAVVVLLLKLLVVSPLVASWHRRADHIAELRKSLADGAQLLRRGDTIRDRWDRMSTNALSSTPTVAERQLFDAFDRWVRESKVTEGSFKPQLKQTDDNYSVMECHAEVTGAYDTIIRFLYDLEKDPMGVQLQGVELTSRDDNGRQISLGLELSGLLLPTTASNQ
jgi:Tfp pilus assembly protein PilO